MGAALGRLLSLSHHLFMSKQEARILMLGLDAAGKTTILYKLKIGEVVSTVATIGFNVETVEYGNISFSVWDIGGQGSLRRLWKHYFHGTQGLIFVVDSSDRERLPDARDELNMLLDEEELRAATLLVFANKQDLPNAMSAVEMAEELGLQSIRHRRWYIQSVSATSRAGLYEAFDWLSTNIKKEVAVPLILVSYS